MTRKEQAQDGAEYNVMRKAAALQLKRALLVFIYICKSPHKIISTGDVQKTTFKSRLKMQ